MLRGRVRPLITIEGRSFTTLDVGSRVLQVERALDSLDVVPGVRPAIVVDGLLPADVVAGLLVASSRRITLVVLPTSRSTGTLRECVVHASQELWSSIRVIRHSALVDLVGVGDHLDVESSHAVVWSSGATQAAHAIWIEVDALIAGCAASIRSRLRGRELVGLFCRGVKPSVMRLVKAMRQLPRIRVACTFSAGTISGLSCIVIALLNRSELLMASTDLYPRRWIREIEEYSPGELAMTPTHARMLLRAGLGQSRVGQSVFVVGLGGEVVAPGLASELESLLDCRVVCGFGSTELAGPVLLGSLKGDFVGYRPLPGRSVAIRPDQGIADGTLLVSSRRGGTYDTGDYVRKRGEAYEIIGRSSTSICVSGTRIPLEQLEVVVQDTLAKHGRASIVHVVASQDVNGPAAESTLTIWTYEPVSALARGETTSRIRALWGAGLSIREWRVMDSSVALESGKLSRRADIVPGHSPE